MPIGNSIEWSIYLFTDLINECIVPASLINALYLMTPDTNSSQSAGKVIWPYLKLTHVSEIRPFKAHEKRGSAQTSHEVHVSPRPWESYQLDSLKVCYQESNLSRHNDQAQQVDNTDKTWLGQALLTQAGLMTHEKGQLLWALALLYSILHYGLVPLSRLLQGHQLDDPDVPLWPTRQNRHDRICLNLDRN